MSELYSVEVEQITGPRVELRVTTVHPDAGPPPAESSFPLNLLVDAWDLLERGFTSLIGTKMSEDKAKALAARAPWGPVFRELRDLSRGAQVPISEAEYHAIDHNDPAWQGQRLAGWGLSNGVHHVHLRGDEEGFRDTAKIMVQGYAQDRLENQDCYRRWVSERVPRARLIVELHDAALLGFLERGMRFDTASWF